MNFVQVKEKPRCRCEHNARWHGKQGECLAVACRCGHYTPVRENTSERLERAA